MKSSLFRAAPIFGFFLGLGLLVWMIDRAGESVGELVTLCVVLYLVGGVGWLVAIEAHRR